MKSPDRGMSEPSSVVLDHGRMAGPIARVLMVPTFLRLRIEHARLSRINESHQPKTADGEACRACGEPFPCPAHISTQEAFARLTADMQNLTRRALS